MASRKRPSKRIHRKPVPLDQLPQGQWDVEDAAAFLGKSKDWVYRHTADGTLPHRKVGQSLRFIPEELVAWVEGAGKRGGGLDPRRSR